MNEVEIASTGTVVHLKGYGFVKVFKLVTPDGGIDYWANYNGSKMPPFAWVIEEYHRGLKQCCGAERAQVHSSRVQRNHIGLAIRAFLRLEWHWFATGISWYEAKLTLVRQAVRSYLAAPRFVLNPTA